MPLNSCRVDKRRRQCYTIWGKPTSSTLLWIGYIIKLQHYKSNSKGAQYVTQQNEIGWKKPKHAVFTEQNGFDFFSQKVELGKRHSRA